MSNVERLLRKFNERPHLAKKLNDVMFLRAKLSYQRDEIKKDYSLFIGELSKQSLEKNRAHLKKIEKTDSADIIMTLHLNSVSASNPLFYHFDSFLVDIRRCVEFCLRMILLNADFNDTAKFKVQNFIDQIMGKTRGEQSEFVKFLIRDHAWFAAYLKGDNKWLEDLNEFRTDTIHYKILNKTEPFKIEYTWRSVQSFEDNPEITLSHIKISGTNINFENFTESYLFKLDFFIEQVIKLNNEILDKKHTIST